MSEDGIDVAWPQGARYNWAQWRGKIDFGMCKATEGLHLLDPDLGDNWNGMWELNRLMPRFAYHYFHPSESPEVQGQFLVSAVKRHGLLPGDHFVMDMEVTDGLPPGIVAVRAARFLHTVNALAPGHRVLVYTNPATARLGTCDGLAPWFLWIANYGVARPAVPKPWTNWTFWQTGDSPVDTDRFNGNHAQLLAFTRMPASR